MENGNKFLAAISYIWILCIVTIFCAKDDAFARYHANQGLVLFIVDTLAGIVGSILEFVLGDIGGIISGALGIVIFVLFIIGIVNALTGKMKPLPIIGGIQIIK